MVYLIITPDPRQGRYLTDLQGNQFWYVKFGDTSQPPDGQQYVGPYGSYTRPNPDFLIHDQGPNTANVDMGPGIGYRQLGKALEIELLKPFNMAHNHVQPPPNNEWHRVARSNSMIGQPGQQHQMTVQDALNNLSELMNIFAQNIIGAQGSDDPNWGILVEGTRIYLGPFTTC